jgi:hypothetical protein
MQLWQMLAELRASGAWWLIALRYSIAVVVGLDVLNQVRKPSRWLGRPFPFAADRLGLAAHPRRRGFPDSRGRLRRRPHH